MLHGTQGVVQTMKGTAFVSIASTSKKIQPIALSQTWILALSPFRFAQRMTCLTSLWKKQFKDTILHTVYGTNLLQESSFSFTSQEVIYWRETTKIVLSTSLAKKSPNSSSVDSEPILENQRTEYGKE